MTVRVVKYLRLRASSNLTSDISMDGVSITSLGNLMKLKVSLFPAGGGTRWS